MTPAVDEVAAPVVDPAAAALPPAASAPPPAEPPPPAPPSGGAPPPPPPPKPGPKPKPKPVGLRDQFQRTIDAGRRLVDAHVALAKAELAVILTDVKQVAALVALAIALLLYILLLVPVGTALFLGEWIFGSMGWGILHGTLFSIATAVILVLIALRVSRTYIAGTLVLAATVGIGVAVVLGLALPNAAYAAIAEAASPGVAAGVAPLLVGVAIWGAILAFVGLVVGARASGAGGAVGGFFVGAIVGALFGAFTAISFSPQVGAALGVTVTLVLWPALAALRLRDYDWEALKQRFTPQASIDAAMETKAYVEARLPGTKEDVA